MSVVFVFNASLSDSAPGSPMRLPVVLMETEKEFVIDCYHMCGLFLLYQLSRLSFVSVVFDFNAPLNDVAAVSSM